MQQRVVTGTTVSETKLHHVCVYRHAQIVVHGMQHVPLVYYTGVRPVWSGDWSVLTYEI